MLIIVKIPITKTYLMVSCDVMLEFLFLLNRQCLIQIVFKVYLLISDYYVLKLQI